MEKFVFYFMSESLVVGLTATLNGQVLAKLEAYALLTLELFFEKLIL